VYGANNAHCVPSDKDDSKAIHSPKKKAKKRAKKRARKKKKRMKNERKKKEKDLPRNEAIRDIPPARFKLAV